MFGTPGIAENPSSSASIPFPSIKPPFLGAPDPPK